MEKMDMVVTEEITNIKFVFFSLELPHSVIKVLLC